MLKYRVYLIAFVLLALVAGCGKSQTADDSNGRVTTIAKAESTQEKPAESALLKQALIDATVELMLTRQPNADVETLRGQAKEMLDQEIRKIRTTYPEFLIVPAATEKKLQEGSSISDSAKRIAVAEGFFDENQLKTSGLVQSWLPQHNAGKLTPVLTELLAQLMTADMKRAEDALTN